MSKAREHPLTASVERLIEQLESRAKFERRRAEEAQIRAAAFEDAASELAEMLMFEPPGQVITCDGCGNLSPPPDEHMCPDCAERETEAAQTLEASPHD